MRVFKRLGSARGGPDVAVKSLESVTGPFHSKGRDRKIHSENAFSAEALLNRPHLAKCSRMPTHMYSVSA